jgi:AsmA protein
VVKGFKLAAGVLGTVLLLLVLASVAVAIFFDLNDYKPGIIAFVKDKTGRDLAIPSDIEATLFPKPSVNLGAIELANAEGFGPEPFAKIESAKVRIKLLPLIKGQVELDSVVIQRLALNLSKDKSGKTNWDDLKLKREQQDTGATPIALAAGGLVFEDAQVTFADQNSGIRNTLDKLNIRTGPLAPDKSVDFDLKSEFATNKPALMGHIEVHGEGKVDPDQKRYQIGTALLKARLTGDSVRNQEVSLQIEGKLSIESEQQRLSFADLQVDVSSGGPDIVGHAKLNTTGEIDLDDKRYDFKNLLVEADLKGTELKVDGELQGAAIFDKPAIAGALKVAQFNPRTVMQQFGVELPTTSDPKVLSEAALRTEIAASSERMDLNKLVFKLDDSTLTGNIAIKNFSKPAITFALTVDEINLDRYRPPAAKTGEALSLGEGGDIIPLDALRGQNIQGTLRIAKLKVLDERATDFVIKVDMRE